MKDIVYLTIPKQKSVIWNKIWLLLVYIS